MFAEIGSTAYCGWSVVSSVSKVSVYFLFVMGYII